ncbi:MAG: hypothetical protein J5I81_07340, partial [Nitrococcus mobilis]|nr:hypothetical protein [Nitrococcus mobilis]
MSWSRLTSGLERARKEAGREFVISRSGVRILSPSSITANDYGSASIEGGEREARGAGSRLLG